MITTDSQPTAFRNRLTNQWSELLVKIESIATLRDRIGHLCFVLAQILEVHGFSKHPISEDQHRQSEFDAMKRGFTEVRGPVPAWEEEPLVWESILLTSLSAQIKQRIPELSQVFDQDLPNLLRFYGFMRLEDSAPSSNYKANLREYMCKHIPISFLRLPANPLKIDRDPSTGKIDLQDVHLASSNHLLEIVALQRMYQPILPEGRPKGIAKPKRSGRPSIPEMDALAAYKAKRSAKKNQSPPWWLHFARSRSCEIPTNPKKLDAFRKKMEDWAIKGKNIATKNLEI